MPRLYEATPFIQALRQREKEIQVPHPYRDQDDLHDIREDIKAIKDQLKRIEPKRSWPIFEAIASQIRSITSEHVAAATFVIIAGAILAYPIYKVYKAPGDIVSCHFNVTADVLVYVSAKRDWSVDHGWGPFKSLDEAKEYAKLNGCPNVSKEKVNE